MFCLINYSCYHIARCSQFPSMSLGDFVTEIPIVLDVFCARQKIFLLRYAGSGPWLEVEAAQNKS